MPNSIKISSATFTKNITAFSVPVRTSLVAEYVLGGSFAASSRNLANAMLPLLEMGTPTYNANSVVVKSNTAGYGFDTQITPSNDCTMLIVRKKSAFAGAVVAGSTVDGIFGISEYGSDCKFYSGSSNFTHGATYAIPAGTPWMFQAGIGSYKGLARVIHYASGSQTVVDDTNLAVGSIGRCYVGSTGITTGQAYTTEVAYFAIYNRKLTAAEVDVAYQSLKKFYALKSISI